MLGTLNIVHIQCDAVAGRLEITPFFGWYWKGEMIPWGEVDWNEVYEKRVVRKGGSTYAYGLGKIRSTCRLKKDRIRIKIDYVGLRPSGQCAAAPHGLAMIEINGKRSIPGVMVHNCMDTMGGRIRYSQADGWQICTGSANVSDMSLDPENTCTPMPRRP